MKDVEKKINQLRKCLYVENSSPVFDLKNPQNFLVKINPDESVSRGMFLPEPLLDGVFRAHPVTIRALKKNILVGGEDSLELSEIHICDSCKQKIDLQFWNFCPFCEASFPIKT